MRAGSDPPARAAMASTRTIRADEREELLALYRKLNPDDPDRPDGLDEQWDAIIESDWVDVVVVEESDTLVATCLLSITPNLTRGARPFAVVENVVTHEDHRGEGYGRKVLDAATELARERDCYKIMLLTGTEKEWKLDFYTSCGFDRERKTAFEKDLR